ncbi:MAG: hypothetical protein COU07_02270 [Candidatus Harrisonbacteria bacterium CG10_big_fil_rev_8_21_14_0_10_40_38]|uniref:RNA polymerase sigma factor n=1 Tax=Candidatus Harrisonbacteria bacterium CG10_big_fil_rev_8_21_14_0_10_40_38 TaxID=1974583 RepID=A0A2H0US69_9BACT|nr:MAG: hypothetical protein COU07_02270 [Candidatus Harrisonbacteria bacterium CG10_big_fil_rev_8_21_14_0_10_40_38]
MSEKPEMQLFLESYDKYAEPIFRHCFFRVFSKSRAEELMQETFMKAWDYVSQKDGKVENMRAFLYKVANNLIIDESRKKKELSLEDIIEESPSLEPSSDTKIGVENKIMARQVMEKLSELSPEDRAVVTLRYVDDLDPKEIADVTGSNANKVSVRLNRALKKLGEKMR